MRGAAISILLCLAACAAADGVTPASASSELRDWQTATGKAPTRAEFAAVVAACQDRAKTADQSGSIDRCLADLGLRRVQ
ncbi:MAG TPA: hypothetical protein VGM07_05300 [Stellaceae bacterium]|jgi:hypothetical protein